MKRTVGGMTLNPMLSLLRSCGGAVLILALTQGCGKSDGTSLEPAAAQADQSVQTAAISPDKSSPESPQQTVLLSHAREFFSCVGLPEDILQITTPKSSFKKELKGVGAADFHKRLKEMKSAPSLKALAAFVALFDSKLAERVQSDPNVKFREICNVVFPLTISDSPLFLVLEPSATSTVAPVLVYYELTIPLEMTMVHDPNDAEHYYYGLGPEVKTATPEVQPDGRLKYSWSPLMHNGLLLAGDSTFIGIHTEVMEENYRAKRDAIESKIKLDEVNEGQAIEAIKAFAKDAVAQVQQKWNTHPQTYDRLITLASCLRRQHDYKTQLSENMEALETEPDGSSPLTTGVVEDMFREYLQQGRVERQPNGYYKMEISQPEKTDGTAYLATYPERWLAAYVPSGAIFCPGDVRLFKLLTPADLVAYTCSKMAFVEYSQSGVQRKQVQLTSGLAYAPVSRCAFHNISSWSRGLGQPEGMIDRAKEEDQFLLAFLSENQERYIIHDLSEWLDENEAAPSCVVKYSHMENSVNGEYRLPPSVATANELIKRISEIFAQQKDHTAEEVAQKFYRKPAK